MSRYDEDLFDNPFFVALEKEALFEKATANRWIICVPKFSSVEKEEITKKDFEDHILIPTTESKSKYTTVSKHVVTVGDGSISLGTGFKENKQVHILFEETFYNKNEECYSVLCVSSFFNRQLRETAEDDTTCDNNSFTQLPVTYQQCLLTLWGHQGSNKTKDNMDKALNGFCVDYQKFEGGNISNLADLVSSQVTAAMQIVLKDHHMKRSIKMNEKFLQGLKIAVETYMMNAVHNNLFATITSCVKSNDAQINKMTRNLVDISLKQLGVRIEFQENLPFARNELSKLNHYSTPLGKLLCIKRVAKALMRPIYNVPGHESLVMTSDDLLPLMIYLIIKSQIPNWTANLFYMKFFLLSKVTDSDEFSFYLSTTEAALDYISSGNLKPSKSGYARQTSGETKSTKEKFFQYVQNGDEAAVQLMLKKPDSCSDDTLSQMCHPLCTCDKCLDIEAKHNQNSGPISAISRDDMGRTALHIAAFYGQANLIDILVKHGCQTVATDYLGCTPLHLAAQNGFQNIILLLVHFCADLNAVDNEGNIPLHLCAKNGHEDCVKAILFLDISRNKLNVNAQNDMGDTPLHLAAKWGYNNIVSFLLESEADPRVRNYKRQMPINIAQNPSIKRDLQTVMNEIPPNINKLPEISNSTSSKPSTILAQFAPAAASSTHQPPYVNPVQPLPSNSTQTWNDNIEHPGTSSLKENVGYTGDKLKNHNGYEIISDKDIRPPVSSKDNSSSQMMSSNTPDVASIDQFNFKQVEKLFKAIANQDLPLVKFYLGWIDSPDSCNNGSTCVSSESSSVSSPTAVPSKLCHPLCQCEDCRHLQKHSSNVLHMDCRNKLGFTPLHITVIENNLDVFMLLLKQGAAVNAQTIKCITPLHLACYHNRQQMVHTLIEYGADVNLQDRHGEIPLHLAAAKANSQLVQFLIKHSSSVSLSNVDGNTALHHAAMANAVDTVHILLENDASPEIVNKYNKSPYHLAKNLEIQEMLRKKVEEVKVRYKKIRIPRSQSVQESIKHEAGEAKDRLVEKDNTLEKHHSKITKELSYGIRNFDKQKILKKSKTFDHNASLVDDEDLKLSLAIKNFDKESSLKHIDTMDKSKTLLKNLALPMSLPSFNAESLKHVEPSDTSTPSHIYSLSQSFSSYTTYYNTTPTIEEVPPTIEEVPPTIEEVSPTIEEVPPTMEEVSPTIEEVQTNIEEVPPTIEEVQPTLEEVRPTIEEVQPSFEEVQPTIEQVSPTIEQVSSTIEQVPPSFEEVSPTIEEVPPTMEEVTPTLEEVPPTIEEITPSFEEVTPTLEEVTPSFEDAPPTFEDTQASIEDVLCTTEDVPHAIEYEPATTEDELPIHDNTLPTVEDMAINIIKEILPSVVDKPYNIKDIIHTNDNTPQSTEDIHHPTLKKHLPPMKTLHPQLK